jgi:glyoxylase-like metal-dependent hydrolase (beta-lactamase superfamily II)
MTIKTIPIFHQFFEPISSTYTYCLASGEGREAIIIDPVKEQVDEYIQFLNQHHIKLVAAIDTHLHADHITGTGLLSKSQQCSIMMGKETAAECIDVGFSDGDCYDFDGIQFKAIYTPGHTDDSYCYYINGHYLFTGDTLLINATGRTDFQHGNAHHHYQSLFEKVLTLPEDTVVYPAHDYNGKTSSTIGQEKKHNPRLQVSNESEYVSMMNNLNLPKPKQMDIAVPANRLCGLTS